jgi:uncharacterized membrane protein YbhN (UPF0104 family)
MRRFLVILIAVAALVAVALSTDYDHLTAAVADMPRSAILLLLGLLAVGTLMTAVRWAFLLRAANLDISWRAGMTTHLAGLATSALPGGSWLAPRLAQEHGHTRMRQAAPALFAITLCDAIALSLLTAFAIVLVEQPRGSLAVPALGFLMAGGLLAMGRSRGVWQAVDRLLARWRLTRRWLPQEADIQESIAALLRASVIARGVAMSVLVSLRSAAVVYVVVNALTISNVTPAEALFTHAFAETSGTIIAVPGGFGVTETSQATALNSLGIGFTRAAFIALTVRTVYLLFKTVVGCVFMLLCYHRLLASMLQLRGRAKAAGWHTWRAVSLGGRLEFLWLPVGRLCTVPWRWTLVNGWRRGSRWPLLMARRAPITLPASTANGD